MSDVKPSRFSRAIRNPGYAATVLRALLKGQFYKIALPLRGIRFSAGRNFQVFGRLTVHGPGRVEFGDNVNVSMHVTPFTHSNEAVISVGDHCFLNGVRFGCATRIEIGDDCILAEARIMDSNFHSTRADRWNPDAPVKTAPVILERNVWVAADAGILPGTRIGENSVVGLAAICNGNFPANSLIAGNPAVVVRQIEQAPEA
jgi:acetyltransferase-like isoleucine patch superfamily enzyme